MVVTEVAEVVASEVVVVVTVVDEVVVEVSIVRKSC